MERGRKDRRGKEGEKHRDRRGETETDVGGEKRERERETVWETEIEKGCEGESGRESVNYIERGYDMDGEETRGSTDTYVCSIEGCWGCGGGRLNLHVLYGRTGGGGGGVGGEEGGCELNSYISSESGPKYMLTSRSTHITRRSSKDCCTPTVPSGVGEIFQFLFS